MPCSDVCIYLVYPIGVKLGDMIGPKYICIVGLFCQLTSYTLLLLIPNYFVVLFAFCLLGIGGGLSFITYQKNVYKYFPNNQGLVNGIVLAGSGLSASILTPIADYVFINPERKPSDSEGFYPKDVADKLVSYLFFLLIMFTIMGVIAVIVTITYEDDDENDSLTNDKNDEKKGEEKVIYLSLKEAFFSNKNKMMAVFCFCGFCKYFNNFI